MAVSLLALLDDIASVLDDVAALAKVAAQKTVALDDVASLTKVAARKTAGVLGDDLALNAEQVAGVVAHRELPVVWAVFKGSLLNKAVLVPAALGISVFAPRLITPLLMLGGLYLAFEGAEKVLHRFMHKEKEKPADDGPANGPANGSAAGQTDIRANIRADISANTSADIRTDIQAETAARPEDLAALEKAKIRGAIRTDFILSAEIIVIALGSLPEHSGILMQAAVLSLIALLMTVGVYGLVAGIVKLDDMGLWLMRRNPRAGAARSLGKGLLRTAPLLMRFLGVAGTIAMFMVGGGILVHGLPWFHAITEKLAGLPLAGLWSAAFNAATGLAAGSLALAGVTLAKRLLPGPPKNPNYS